MTLDTAPSTTSPYLMDGAGYRASLRDGRRVVNAAGQVVEDVTAEPGLAAGVDTIAAYYDAQHAPGTRDLLTYVDDELGERVSVAWMAPRSKDDLHRRHEVLRWSTWQSFGVFGRPPDYGPLVPIGFLSIADLVAQVDPSGAGVRNVEAFIRWGRRHNLVSADLVADVQSDRRVPVSEKAGRLRAVRETGEGIYVYGAKPCSSVAAQGHLGTIVTALTPGADPDAAIFGWVPVNAPGLTLVSREAVTALSSREDHPLDVQGEEADTMLLFEDVFIPHEHLFSFRRMEMLPIYYLQGTLAHWHIMTRIACKAEIFAGTGQLIAEMLGTTGIPQVRDQIAELTQYASTLAAFATAAEETATMMNGICVPNERFTTAGRLHSIVEYPRMLHILREMSGQGLISRFTEAAFDSPLVADLMREFLPGTGVDAKAKNRLFNFVWDLACGANAARVALFENVNSTPPPAIRARIYDQPARREWRDRLAQYLDLPPLEA